MNEQNAKYERLLVGVSPSHETNLSLLASRPEVSLCHDDESCFSLESDFIVNASLTGLDDKIDASLIPLLLFAPSSLSTLRGTTNGVLTLRVSPIPLA